MTGGEKNSFGLKSSPRDKDDSASCGTIRTGSVFGSSGSVYARADAPVGGDGSEAFRKMITLMALQMLREAKQLEEYEKEWKAVEGDV